MKCKKCGENIGNGEIACPSCHTPVALMSQIKTEEDQREIQEDQIEEVREEQIHTDEMNSIEEPVVIQFDSNVLKEVNNSEVPLEQPVPLENPSNSAMMPIIEDMPESVDADEVKKALEQYGPSTPKDIRFFLPIIIGIIAIIAIVIGIIYGIKVLL